MEDFESSEDTLEEEESSSNVKIDLPQDPEVDPQIYKDVEALLYQGFVHAHLDINGVHFVFKSLNQHEFTLLHYLLSPKNQNPAKYHSLFLAYGVLAIDGTSILRERDRWIPEIAKSFENLPESARGRVIRLLGQINRRASSAVILTEAYAMESYSRYRWLQLKGLDLTHPNVTGFPGTELLGYNWGQLIWRALNSYDDLRQEVEREWENAKFIGSCFAGKGISKIYKQDTDRRRKEHDTRIARKIDIVNHVLLGTSLEQQGQRKGDQIMLAAQTVNQLAQQLEASLRGEKDWHDEVVSMIEERQRSQEEQRQQELEQAAKEREERYANQHVIAVGNADMTGMTAEEVAKAIASRKPVAVVEENPVHNGFLHKLGSIKPPIVGSRK